MILDTHNELFVRQHLSQDKLKELIIKYKKCDNEEEKFKLRDEIFFSVAKFINKTIHKNKNIKREEFDDVFSYSFIGFSRCLEKFDLNNKNSFVTYLYFWILKSIRDYNDSKKLIIVTTVQELKKKSSIISKINSNRIVYLDSYIKNINTNENRKLEDIIGDNFKFEKSLFDNFESEHLGKILKEKLCDYEIMFIKYRFFVENTLSHREFSEIFKISKFNVKNIEDSILLKLRNAFTNNCLIVNDKCKNINIENLPNEQKMQEYYENKCNKISIK